MAASPLTRPQAWLHACLGDHARPSPARSATRWLLLATMLLAVTVVVLGTLKGLSANVLDGLDYGYHFSMSLFALELLGRLWVAPLDRPLGADGRVLSAWAARRRYLLSFVGLVDWLLILFWGLSSFLLGPDAQLVALLSLLKLARHSPSLAIFAAVFRQEGRSLLAGMLVMGELWLLASGVMYLLEREAQPHCFGSIPQAMWWGIVTLATVGYGDATPITPLGKIFGGFTMLLGVAMFAIPAGILANGFAQELRRRDFVVTWQAVAGVPLFAGLDAGRIAGIAELLKVHLVPAHQVVVRKGDSADAMYFILSGEVSVDVPGRVVHLGKGQFFGEIALIQAARRTATVTTLRDCRLLALGVDDFSRLMERNPELRAAIEKEAARRLSQSDESIPGSPS